MVIKINRNRIILFVLLVIALVTISGCTKPECKTSADCLSKACTLSKCESKKCVYTQQPNCCGNGAKDSIENGKQGNQCTCPQDYGKCEGKAKTRVGSREEDAAYVHYYCSSDSQCVLGTESKDIAPQNFLDAIDIGFFKASSVVKYNKPFDVSKDSFEFKITLDDTSKDLILPVELTKLKLLYSSDYSRSELLIAEKDLGNSLNTIGDSARISTPLTLGYKPQELEETGSLRYIVDYTYTKQVVSGRTVNGTNIYSNEQVRGTFNSPSKQVFFVRNG